MSNRVTIYTPVQAAETLGVAPKTLSSWRSKGRGPAYMIRREPSRGQPRVFYLASDVREFASTRSTD